MALDEQGTILKKKILSIDPAGESGGGGETGIVLAEYGDDTPYTIVDYWAIPSGVNAFRLWLNDNEALKRLDTVICEDFIQWKQTSDPTPLKVIGAVQLTWPRVILRPAGRRSWVTDEQMKLLNAYIAGGHHRDVTEAARHAVSWLAKDQKHVPTQRVILT